MTPEQHNKYLGWSHLVYAGLHVLMGLAFGFMMILLFSTMPAQRSGDQAPPAFFIGMGIFMALFSMAWSSPSLIAGYALLKKKRWARMAGLIAGVFASTQMPLGVAVGVYTYWFMFSPPGRWLYPALPAGQGELTGKTEPETRYIPPESPPDWR